MPTKQYQHISEFDPNSITFGTVDAVGIKKDKVKVDVFRDSSSTVASNRFNRFNLCRDASEPMIARYSLDSIRDDTIYPDRRGLTITVSDSVTRAALEAIDEVVIKKAVECSKEWFGKAGKPLAQPLSEAVVRDRYQPLIYFKDDGDDEKVVKIKVKTGGQIPTAMHLNDDGRFRKLGATAEHLTRGSGVVPVVSMSYGIWIIPGGKFGLSMFAEEMLVTPGGDVSNDLSHFASSKPIAVHPPPTPQPVVVVNYERMPVVKDDDDDDSM